MVVSHRQVREAISVEVSNRYKIRGISNCKGSLRSKAAVPLSQKDGDIVAIEVYHYQILDPIPVQVSNSYISREISDFKGSRGSKDTVTLSQEDRDGRSKRFATAKS